jgi:choline dehydrogenase-like flavoprotein
MGGMRLSVSPNGGVVDPNLRLHGMDNGYICSSAVFPTSGYSNPTHTLLALAVRLAEHLR